MTRPSEGEVVAGRRPVLELFEGNRPVSRLLIAQGLAPSAVLTKIKAAADKAAVPVRTVPRVEIDRHAPRSNHQGVIAFTTSFEYAELEDLLERPNPSLLFLDGVTDPQNLGSLMRSAEVAGFTGIVLPVRRSAGVTETVRRVAAGAAEFLPVARVTNLRRALESAKEAGLWAVGLDGSSETPLWDSNLMTPPVLLVLGAEDKGISQSVKQACDAVVSIPGSGKVESLNVAVAGAIAMFEVARNRDGSATL